MRLFSLCIPGREEIHLELDLDDSGQIRSHRLKAVGPLDFLNKAQNFRASLKGDLAKVLAPQGRDTFSLMIMRILYWARTSSLCPVRSQEICHCRKVNLDLIEGAILIGAHTPEAVSSLTSASTACGTCRTDIERIIRELIS